MQKSEAGQGEWVVEATIIATVDFKDCMRGLQIEEGMALIVFCINVSITWFTVPVKNEV